MHARAVYVLASLGNEHLIEHLKARLNANGLLHNYENHALIALGTDAAGFLFSQSVKAVGERLATLPNDAANNTSRYELIRPIQFLKPDIRYLITPAFESCLLRLIESDNPDITWIGSDLVRRSATASLLYHVSTASARQNRWSDSFSTFGERSVVTAELWLDWWGNTIDPAVQKKLLRLTPLCPSLEVEKVLLECLDTDELRAQAARQLGEYGAVRAAPCLREILAENTNDSALRDQMEAAHALGDLRDDAAIPLLKAMISAHTESLAAIYAVASLGVIGTSEAETALCELLAEGVNEERIAPALINCGSPSAMAAVLARAKARSNGPEWLCEQASRLSYTRGWTRGRYYTHIDTADFVQYLDTTNQAASSKQNWGVIRAFEQIDSPDVRHLLRKWAERRGTLSDPVVRENDSLRMSQLCIRELTDRGDEFAAQKPKRDGPVARAGFPRRFVARHIQEFGRELFPRGSTCPERGPKEANRRHYDWEKPKGLAGVEL